MNAALLDEIQRVSGCTWAEIAAKVGCSEATLYALRNHSRGASRKLERRIVEHASSLGIAGVGKSEGPAMLRESVLPYGEPPQDTWRRDMERRVSALEQAMVRLSAGHGGTET